MGTKEKRRVQDILDKYFDAGTTLEEEKFLREYFRGKVDGEFIMYKPLFECFSEEIQSVNAAEPKKFNFKLASLIAAAAVAIFALIVIPERDSSLRLIIDGVSVNNRELALSKADTQLGQVNSLLEKFRGETTDKLESMNRVGEAISPLSALNRVLTQKGDDNRLDNED